VGVKIQFIPKGKPFAADSGGVARGTVPQRFLNHRSQRFISGTDANAVKDKRICRNGN
jgi:hypothetical protein